MTARKNLIVAYVAGLLAPYVLTVLLLRTSDTLFLLLLELLCLLTVVGLTIYLFRSASNKRLRNLFPVVTFSAVFLYLMTYANLVNAADFLFFIRRQNKLERVINSINHSTDKDAKLKNILPELKELGIINASMIDDQVISFTIDCFIDNGSGIAFSNTLKPPNRGHLGCGGQLIRWVRLKDNWFAWGEN
jgi:hypothetical protein